MNNNLFLSHKISLLNRETDKTKVHKAKQTGSSSLKFPLEKRNKAKEKRRQLYSTKAKYYKSIDFDSKYLRVIDKPKTPHNTGQFIMNTFNSSQKQEGFDFNSSGFDVVDFCFELNDQTRTLKEESNDFLFKRGRYLSTDANVIPALDEEKGDKSKIDMEIDNVLALHKIHSSFLDLDDLSIEELSEDNCNQ